MWVGVVGRLGVAGTRVAGNDGCSVWSFYFVAVVGRLKNKGAQVCH